MIRKRKHLQSCVIVLVLLLLTGMVLPAAYVSAAEEKSVPAIDSVAGVGPDEQVVTTEDDMEAPTEEDAKLAEDQDCALSDSNNDKIEETIHSEENQSGILDDDLLESIIPPNFQTGDKAFPEGEAAGTEGQSVEEDNSDSERVASKTEAGGMLSANPDAITEDTVISELFPDALFASDIAAVLGKQVGDVVTQAELDGIQNINVSGAVHDLEGIQYLNGLTSLRVANSQLTQRFPEEFLTDIYPQLSTYVADNQRYVNPTIEIDNPSLEAVVAQVPPLLLQIAENSNGEPVGEWIILNEFNAEIERIPAVNGDELLQFTFVDSGRYNVNLVLGTDVWMGLDNSLYFFPVEFENTTGILRGTVTGENGAPMAGVTIALQDGRQVETDVDGNYTFGYVTADTYTVTASLTGYSTQQKQGVVSIGETTVVNFTMVASRGSIAGQVENSLTGQPVAGATVLLYNSDNEIVGQTTSDSVGGFVFNNLEAGIYLASAAANGYNTGTRPGIPVGANETTEATVFLTPVPVLLYGYVTNALTGEPIEGATITVGGLDLTTDGDGRYEIIQFPGDVVVSAAASGYGSQQVTVVIGSADIRQDFALVPNPGIISGRVTDDADALLAGVTITLSNGVSVSTDTNGEYSVTLEPGSYTITASLTGYESVTVADELVTSGETTTVNFVLRREIGSLTGVVTDAQTGLPIEGAVVTLTGGRTAITNNQGVYIFEDLPIGEYTATASMSGYGSQAEEVGIFIGEQTEQNFTLNENPVTVIVRVFYPNGTTPADGVLVEWSDDHEGTTDANGSLTFTLDPDGYGLTLTKTSYAIIRDTVQLEVGETEPVILEYVLEELPGALRGAVLNAYTRVPIAEATITIVETGETTSTDADGMYSFTGLAAGSYTVSVSMVNFQSVQRSGVLVPADGTGVASFALVPAFGSLTGTVRDEQGNVMPGVTISLNNGQLVETDSNGRYLFFLEANEYEVTASAAKYESETKEAGVLSDNTTVVDFVLQPLPGILTGRVTDAVTGQPIAGATLRIDTLTRLGLTVVTDSDGVYSVELTADSYNISVTATGYGATAGTAQVMNAETTVANFVLNPNPGVLEGTIVDEDGNPVAGATVTVGPLGVVVVTDANGFYQVELVAGTYAVTVAAKGYQTASASVAVASNSTTVLNFVLITIVNPIPPGPEPGPTPTPQPAPGEDPQGIATGTAVVASAAATWDMSFQLLPVLLVTASFALGGLGYYAKERQG